MILPPTYNWGHPVPSNGCGYEPAVCPIHPGPQPCNQIAPTAEEALARVLPSRRRQSLSKTARDIIDSTVRQSRPYRRHDV